MRVAVVGATGAVGTVMLAKLRERGFPADAIVPFASERSAGRELEGATEPVRELRDDTIGGFDVAIFSAGATTSRAWAQKFVDGGAVVVDNSSAFRQQDGVPLVVAEVNPEAMDGHNGIVANPNCSTMELMLPAKALHDAAGIERLIVSTYQCVSGTGVKAVSELETQTKAALAGHPLPEPQVYPHHIAFNVLGGAGNFAEGDDHTDEERKMMFETRKILGDQDIAISVTCARVPVTYSHSLSVNLQTRDELSVEEARGLIAAFPGCEVVDDPATNSYPTARDAAGRDEVFVGRIRRDPSHPRAINLWVVSDNLYKGAATNAVQLVEVLLQRGLIGSRAAA